MPLTQEEIKKLFDLHLKIGAGKPLSIIDYGWYCMKMDILLPGVLISTTGQLQLTTGTGEPNGK